MHAMKRALGFGVATG